MAVADTVSAGIEILSTNASNLAKAAAAAEQADTAYAEAQEAYNSAKTLADQSDAALLRGNANGLQLQVNNPTVVGSEYDDLVAALNNAKAAADAAEEADAKLASADTALTNAKTLAEDTDAAALAEDADKAAELLELAQTAPAKRVTADEDQSNANALRTKADQTNADDLSNAAEEAQGIAAAAEADDKAQADASQSLSDLQQQHQDAVKADTAAG